MLEDAKIRGRIETLREILSERSRVLEAQKQKTTKSG